jgi:predicted amidohydrolase
MKEELNICMLQCDLHWEDAQKNRSQIEDHLATVQDVDLILLPEMFSTGFSVESAHLVETMDGETINWMKTLAQNKAAAVCGSIMIKENGNIYNRLLWVESNGTIQHYDKRHLFSLINEEKHFTAGTERLIIEYKGWKICPLICYDLRFPVFSRNDVDYELLIYIANWPDKRIGAWNALLKARAIENQSYVVGLNRVGEDGYKAVYSGHSQVIDADGDLISVAPENEVGLVEFTLTKKHLLKLRTRLPFLNDRDEFELMND